MAPDERCWGAVGSQPAATWVGTGGAGSTLLFNEAHFPLKQAGLGPFWGPSCSHTPLSLASGWGPGWPYLLFLPQVSTLKGQLQQELRRSSAPFAPSSGPPGE